MKKAFNCLFLLIVLFGASIFAQTSIAVLDFEGKGVSKVETSVLTDRLRNELVKTKYFRVIERQEMSKILAEQKFQASGCTSTECAVEIGQLLGVERIAVGSIGKVGNIYTVSSRVVDVESGELTNVSDYDYEGDRGGLLKYGMKSVAQELAGKDPEEIVIPQKKQSSAVPAPSSTTSTYYDYRKESKKKEKGNWYFSLLGLGPTLRTSNEDITSFIDAEWLQLRYKNIQYKATGYTICSSCYEDEESDIEDEKRNISIAANGIGLFYNIKNSLGVNVWYYRDAFISARGVIEHIEDDVEYFEISLQWESSKSFLFGVQFEGGLLINPSNNSYLDSMDGFFIKAKVIALSFGSNY